MYQLLAVLEAVFLLYLACVKTQNSQHRLYFNVLLDAKALQHLQIYLNCC